MFRYCKLLSWQGWKIGHRYPGWYSHWQSQSQESKWKKKYLSCILCHSYPIAFYTAIKRAKRWTRNRDASGKIMFCLSSGAEGSGKKLGAWKGKEGDKEDNLLLPRIGLICIFFLRKCSHCIRAGKGWKSGTIIPMEYKAAVWGGWQATDGGLTCPWRCPARQHGARGRGGGRPGRRHLLASRAAWPPSPFTSPPSQPASLPPSLQNWTQVSCNIHICRSQRCPSESWAKTDAGGKSARARTSCARPPPSGLHHHGHWGFPAVVESRKPLGKWALIAFLFSWPLACGLSHRGGIVNSCGQTAQRGMHLVMR